MYLQDNCAALEIEKQHFNDRLEHKDTAMVDLSEKFAELAKERDALMCKCDWFRTQLKQTTPENVQSRKDLLDKKFKEVEDLYDELHRTNIEMKGLKHQYKEAERVVVNQDKIIKQQTMELQRKNLEIRVRYAVLTHFLWMPTI